MQTPTQTHTVQLTAELISAVTRGTLENIRWETASLYETNITGKVLTNSIMQQFVRPKHLQMLFSAKRKNVLLFKGR